MTIIGSGIDIIEVGRIKKVVKEWGDKFLARVFTKDELAYCTLDGSIKFQSLAARFAAKEAVVKAVGRKDIALKDIEIINDGDGRPECVINSARQSPLRLRSGQAVTRILISISHTKEYAVAQAIVFA